MGPPIDIPGTVRAEIRTLLQSRGHPAVEVSANDELTATLGLTSMDVLALVPRLNAAFALDPVEEEVAITSVRTVADLVKAYVEVRARRTGSVLDAAAARAATRRHRGKR